MDIEKIKFCFESILCLCSEGPEFMNKVSLCNLVMKEANIGMDLCNDNPPCSVCSEPSKVHLDFCKRCGAALL